MDKIWIKYFIETGKGKQKQSSLNAKKTIKASELKKNKTKKAEKCSSCLFVLEVIVELYF